MMHTQTIRVTRHAEFEMAHILEGYKGGCGNLHGHSYKIEVTVEGVPTSDNYGFVMDFKQLDAVIKQVIPDHKFVASSNAETCSSGPEHAILEVLKTYGLAYEIMHGTSAECMVSQFAESIQGLLPDGLTVCEVNLWETTNSHATWVRPVTY